MSGGSGRRLLVNVFALGAIVTALLSLDVTVIVLTPIVYATVVALRVDPLPYLYACEPPPPEPQHPSPPSKFPRRHLSPVARFVVDHAPCDVLLLYAGPQ